MPARMRCPRRNCWKWTAMPSRRRRCWPRPLTADYARYEFHLVVQRLQTYCSEDLGGFYLDVLKDRLYTTAPDSIARRSAQTALAMIRDVLLQLMAPILSFTAEEAWRLVHGEDPTIFVRTWKDALAQERDAEVLVAKWRRILAVRAASRGNSRLSGNPARSARRCRPKWRLRRPLRITKHWHAGQRFALCHDHVRRDRRCRRRTDSPGHAER